MENIEEIRREYWLRGMMKNHTPEGIKNLLSVLWTFTSIVFGDTKKGQGDIVIVNASKGLFSDIKLEEYLKHFLLIDRIETVGIYTNIYFSKDFFSCVNEYIITRPKLGE